MRTPTTTPRPTERDERLDVADALLKDSLTLPPGVAARACTWLIRLALEHALDDFWARHAPDIGGASRRAQLLVFKRMTNADLGQRYNQLWSELSNAAHHHAYELAPTAIELRSWHGDAAGIIAALQTIEPRNPAPPPRSGGLG